MSRARALLAVFALLTVGLVGCSDDDTPTPNDQLPAGTELVNQAAEATGALKSAHVKIETDGEVGSLPMRAAEGDLLRSGDAKGTVQLSVMGILIENDFVAVGGKIYLKGATGGWQTMDASQVSSIYDPSAILDPERGIAKLLSSAKEPTTEAQEKVDGKDAYRVAVKLDATAVSSLIPGVGGDVTGKLWLDTATKQLLKAVLTVPGESEGKTGTVTINVTNIDAPVTVSVPSS
jgi:lipoprotein LprG